MLQCMRMGTNKREVIAIHVLDNQPTANEHLSVIELVYALEILKLDLSMNLRGRSNFSYYLVISLPYLISSLMTVYLDITFVEKPISSPRPLLKGGSPVYFCN